MSADTPTQVVWRVLSAVWIDTDPQVDVIALSLQASGKMYCVTCAGPKDMSSNEFIPAVRAACAAMIAACGGDMSVVGVGTAETAEIAKFDTGDQRAS